MTDMADSILMGIVFLLIIGLVVGIVYECIRSFLSIFGYDLTFWQTLATTLLFVLAVPSSRKSD